MDLFGDDLFGENGNDDGEDAGHDEDDDGDNDGNGPETGLVQTRLSPIVAGLSLAHFEGTFEKLDQQLFAMQNADHPQTPEERWYSNDHLYQMAVATNFREECISLMKMAMVKVDICLHK